MDVAFIAHFASYIATAALYQGIRAAETTAIASHEIRACETDEKIFKSLAVWYDDPVEYEMLMEKAEEQRQRRLRLEKFIHAGIVEKMFTSRDALLKGKPERYI